MRKQIFLCCAFSIMCAASTYGQNAGNKAATQSAPASTASSSPYQSRDASKRNFSKSDFQKKVAELDAILAGKTTENSQNKLEDIGKMIQEEMRILEDRFSMARSNKNEKDMAAYKSLIEKQSQTYSDIISASVNATANSKQIISLLTEFSHNAI